MGIISKILGDTNQKVLDKLAPIVDEINSLEGEYEKLSDEDLKIKTGNLKEKVKKDIESGKDEMKVLDEILPEAFAMVREAGKRTLHQRHFDVQLLGGIVLHQGKISEMKTGEGKTLVATLPVFLNALCGKGVHIVTVNDYLAKRDTQWMGPIYDLLGMTCGCIQHEKAFLFHKEGDIELYGEKNLVPVSRKEAYSADITYGTNNEFGFDYLRDNMVSDLTQCVQRDLNYAIVDEVDSILIDESRTPLIISAPAEESTELYYKFARLVPNLVENEDYNVDEKMRAVTLTEKGISKMEGWLGVSNIYEEKGIELVHHIEQSLKAHALFKRDKDYVVKDGEVVIVDEFTGRLMFGRRYSEGLHQAIEAKENVEIKKESQTLATITFQNYFRIYKKLAGMTGTAATEAEEFHKIYNLDVVIIPTNKPLIRTEYPDLIYKTEEAKFKAVVEEIKRRNETGQPVLVGTVSIEKNEILGNLLHRNGIQCEILNAKNHEREAAIISQAGKKGAVTVATNMAGRGVDIILGGNPQDKKEAEWIVKFGGLHVIGTERHEARRIDNQLRGRAGRQGDPGSSQFFVSLEDELMRIFGGERIHGLMDRLGLPEDQPIQHSMITSALENAQKKVEGNNFDIRKHLLEYDDVMNKHREVIYAKRKEILEKPEFVRSQILDLIDSEIKNIVNLHTQGDVYEWNLKEIYETVNTIFPLNENVKNEILGAKNKENLVKYLIDLSHNLYEEKEKITTPETMRILERAVYLRVIDTLWIEHLDATSAVREGIGLRGYGQRDPLVEFKHESYNMFQRLLAKIQSGVVYTIYKVEIAREQPLSSTSESPLSVPKGEIRESHGEEVVPKTISKKHKIGRNDPCPCGSGKKYKKCCGR